MASRRNSTKKAATKKKATARKPVVKKAAAKKAAAKKTVAKKASTKKPAFNPKTDSANDPAWVAPLWGDDVLLGAHVSFAGGTHEAPRRAEFDTHRT